MNSILEVIREAKRPERTATVCLRGDLVSEHEDLEKHLVKTRAEGGETDPIVGRIAELQQAMQNAMVTFRFRAIGSMGSLDLAAGHPARPDDDDDKRLGYNRSTYYPAVIRACCYAIERDEETLSPDEVTDEDWTALLDALSSTQFDKVFGAAWLCDHEDVEVPTSPLALLISQRTSESSTQPSAGESARNGSQGGNRRGSRRTSTTKKAASSEA